MLPDAWVDMISKALQSISAKIVFVLGNFEEDWIKV